MDLRLEKRISPRRNTYIAAFVAFGGQSLPCIVRNVSDGGAKLEFNHVGGIPQSFDLLVPGHRPQRCKVAWRALREMGVQFISEK